MRKMKCVKCNGRCDENADYCGVCTLGVRGWKQARKVQAENGSLKDENAKLRKSLKLLELQRYGLTNAWACCDWRKCEKHGTYARGENWGAIEGKDGAVCPWCNAAELSSDDNKGLNK